MIDLVAVMIEEVLPVLILLMYSLRFLLVSNVSKDLLFWVFFFLLGNFGVSTATVGVKPCKAQVQDLLWRLKNFKNEAN